MALEKTIDLSCFRPPDSTENSPTLVGLFSVELIVTQLVKKYPGIYDSHGAQMLF
jgi:hypothetical protein